MGQAAVRSAIQSALEAQSFPLVGTVYAARAYIGEEDYEMNASQAYVENLNGSGCVLVVNLPGPDKRERMTLTGRGAVDDTNVHRAVLELFFASTGGEPVQAQQDYDSVVDAIVIYIRGNPNLTAPDTVWSSGEYKAGVVHRASAPFTDPDGMTVFIYGTIEWEVWEWIAGTAGDV